LFDTVDHRAYHRPAAHRAADQHRSARHSDPPGRSRWHWLLLVPVVLPLVTPLYNRVEPRLFGLPFFYWFQLSLVGLSTFVITVVHLKTKRRT